MFITSPKICVVPLPVIALAFSPPVNCKVPAFVTPALVINSLASVLSVAPSAIDTVFCAIAPLFVVVPDTIFVEVR